MLSGYALGHGNNQLPESQQQFFNQLSQYCGKAFEGKVVTDTPKSGGFEGRLVMHVRYCDDNQIQIPFHVGSDASRTWIVTKKHGGLELKHDHRHKDGSEDELTMYGGLTKDAGYPQVQSFPADEFTKDLFVRMAIPVSNDNTWQFFIYPKTFTYRMVRPAREFRVDFDLTKPITPPAAPWGYSD
ncbi:hypothetical protein [Thalassotalea sp. LPB0316]|uniref:hypothetical protein n=1 Tax=Thalassotalea sp. LPB0316 TaxID=2769490 RepID=UPI001D041DFF|nr:hypothetical protein [Thalassotalea sp. LPB0316]